MKWCECCDRVAEDVEERPAMTAYFWDGEGEDPNRPVSLCPPCWEEHKAHWEEMWANYYSGLL